VVFGDADRAKVLADMMEEHMDITERNETKIS
jgi:hypothetical protein